MIPAIWGVTGSATVKCTSPVCPKLRKKALTSVPSGMPSCSARIWARALTCFLVLRLKIVVSFDELIYQSIPYGINYNTRLAHLRIVQGKSEARKRGVLAGE